MPVPHAWGLAHRLLFPQPGAVVPLLDAGRAALGSAGAVAPWGHQQQSNHNATAPVPPPGADPSWQQSDPGTHPSAPAPSGRVRAAGPEALLNIAADLLTALPGRQRAEFPPTSFTFGFQAF